MITIGKKLFHFIGRIIPVLVFVAPLCYSSVTELDKLGILTTDTDEVYYSRTMGYIIMKKDTLMMYAPEMCDSSKFYPAAECSYSYNDPRHIQIQTFNTVNEHEYRLNQFSIESHISEDPDSVTFNLEILDNKDTGFYTEIRLTGPSPFNSNNIVRSGITTNGHMTIKYNKTGLYNQNHEKYKYILEINLKPYKYEYTPSDPNGRFYGRLYCICYPFYELQDYDIFDIKVTGLSELNLKQYFIEPDYITKSQDGDTLFWRGYYYERIQ